MLCIVYGYPGEHALFARVSIHFKNRGQDCEALNMVLGKFLHSQLHAAYTAALDVLITSQESEQGWVTTVCLTVRPGLET
jgi:hypothetical protein